MWVVRPQLGSRIVGSAEAAVGLSPEEIRARRNVACVAHKPLVIFFCSNENLPGRPARVPRSCDCDIPVICPM